MASFDEDRDRPKSIFKDLLLNQYQAILLGGVAVASLISLNPIPLLVWLGGELVMLPVLDSGPFRRLVIRRKLARARAETESRRARVIGSFTPMYARRYSEMVQLCRLIESNYQGLHGTSQVYIFEQREKLDMILEGCMHRMLALQRYERMLASRDDSRVAQEVQRLLQELEQPDLNERARAALQKNLELKRKLISSDQEARGTVKALSTELDSMVSLLEVLHQNSISMRDPAAISSELDSIVRQSEDSERVVQEMEALFRVGTSDWRDYDVSTPIDSGSGPRTSSTGPSRQRVKNS